MIWTHLTATMIILGLFGIAIMLYSVPKAYVIVKRAAKASMEEKYELEKSFYLLSTVVWVILITRLVASALFWITNESLIPIIPGAMCQFGVNQAGSPYSWINNGVKLIIVLIYGNWLMLDLLNRRVNGAPLIISLSKLFLIITPLLFLDLFLDLGFYFTISPVVVPCCRVIFVPQIPLPCPYCFVFHDAPMLITVIASYGLSICLSIWSLVIRHYIKKYPEIEEVAVNFIRRLMVFSLGFSILGTIALIPAILQVMTPIVPIH
ncbi:MAG: hypothetical protein NZ922_04565 [Candidatus Methanomethyliaceae archaeon]|nr:hypothetical protein [Candidatus Methanomethyliaceae archaeon]MDW7971100.1 hypothetical protein [Nitrososphaerota archaeon]